MHKIDAAHCHLATELQLMNARSSVYLRMFSQEKVSLFLKGGIARKWEGELDATEKKLRNHLDILVKSETIAGYTRDRAREHSHLTRYIFFALRHSLSTPRYSPFHSNYIMTFLSRKSSMVIENEHARAFWDTHFSNQREVSFIRVVARVPRRMPGWVDESGLTCNALAGQH